MVVTITLETERAVDRRDCVVHLVEGLRRRLRVQSDFTCMGGPVYVVGSWIEDVTVYGCLLGSTGCHTDT